jgi:outer membrane protein OmpA-like peptidoglycan-associated protein
MNVRNAITRTLGLVALALGLAGWLGCGASGPSAELVDARRAYDRARTGDAAALVPDQVIEAQHALRRAEAAENGSGNERNLAYVAQRMAELAMANAETAMARRQHAAAEAAYTQRLEHAASTRAAELEAARRRLETTKVRLEAVQTEAATKDSELALRDRELAAEREARLHAETEAKAALESLQRIADVRQEQRETIITLNGAVLFEFNRAVLLPIARTRLEEVATALKEMADGSTMIVEGHTDARGSDDGNLALSQARAEAVVSFLVSRGVEPTRIRAVGRGEEEPVADNRTAEGRANNRRVEIRVLAPERDAAAP